MTDIWTKAKRSKVMSNIRSKDTKPEKLVRTLLHNEGFRFRLHRKDLPGKPDITLPKYKSVIFVHGCFWHNHSKCIDGKIPKTNTAFWKNKISKNIERNENNIKNLKQLGWKVLIVWECEVENNINKIRGKINRFLV